MIQYAPLMTRIILLFDIDGTLLLSGGAGKIAFEKAIYEILGLKKEWGSLRPDGKTDPMIIEELLREVMQRDLTPEEYDALCQRYHDHFAVEIKTSERFRLMPGIVELLNFLQGHKHLHLGIATGNFETAARIKLQHGGLDHFFHFGGFASDSGDRRELTRIAYERGLQFAGEEIPTERVFVIGDSVHDITAGKALGAKTVSVTTGSTPKEDLLALQPDFLFDDLSDTARFCETLALHGVKNGRSI